MVLQIARGRADDAAELAHVGAHKGKRELARQKLVIGQPLKEHRLRRNILPVLRLMQRAKGLGKSGPLLLSEIGIVQPFGQIRQLCERHCHRFLQGLGREARRHRIHWFDRWHVGGLFRRQSVVRMDHLRTLVEPFDLAGNNTPLANGKGLLQPVPAGVEEDKGD